MSQSHSRRVALFALLVALVGISTSSSSLTPLAEASALRPQPVPVKKSAVVEASSIVVVGGSELLEGPAASGGLSIKVGYSASASVPEVVAYKWRIRKAKPSSSSAAATASVAAVAAASDETPEDAVYGAKSGVGGVPMELVTIAANLTEKSAHYPLTEVCLDVAGADSEEGTIAAGAAVTVAPCDPTADPNTITRASQRWYWGADTTIRSALNTQLCVCSDPFRNRSDTRTFFEAFLAECNPLNVWQRHAHESEAPGSIPASHHLWTGSLYFLIQQR